MTGNKGAGMDVLRLTLRQLQVFVAVARSGSTTAASAQIALSQSATSAAVNELERLLSLKLFDRAGKRLLLNDNGRALQPRALALLDGAACPGRCKSEPPYRPNSEPGMEAAGESLRAVDEFSLGG